MRCSHIDANGVSILNQIFLQRYLPSKRDIDLVWPTKSQTSKTITNDGDDGDDNEETEEKKEAKSPTERNINDCEKKSEFEATMTRTQMLQVAINVLKCNFGQRDKNWNDKLKGRGRIHAGGVSGTKNHKNNTFSNIRDKFFDR